MKYNFKKIMVDAWKIYRKGGVSFSEALKRSWITAKAAEANADRIRAAKGTAGITEEVHTWYGWKAAGREVIHEMKALFQVKVIDGATKTGERIISYFGLSQTEIILETV